MKHNVNLQIMRGFAASLIFITHFMLIERKVKGHPGLMGDWGYIGAIAVDLFFVISGFIMVRIETGRFQLADEWKRYALQRVARIYPTYWAFSFAVLAVYLVRPDMVNHSQNGHVDLVASFLLLPQALIPLLPVGWTLVHEMYFYIVFMMFIAWLPEKALPFALAIWAVITIVLDRSVAGHGSPLVDLISNPLTMNFIAGAFAALAMPYLPRRAGFWAIAIAIGWLALALSMTMLRIEEIFMAPWMRVLVCAVPCTFLTLGYVQIDRQPAGRFRRLAAWIGDRSYSFYLGHLLVLSALAKLWTLFRSEGDWDSVLMFFVSYAACVAVAHAGFSWLEIPSSRVAKRWLERTLPRSRAHPISSGTPNGTTTTHP